MKPRFFRTTGAWRTWLERHHADASELWVGFWKRGSGKPSITWPESVDGALCFGWIDGLRRSLGEDSYTIRFTPRRVRSIWSAVNLERVSELERLGLMSEAGRRVFAARDPRRAGLYSFEQKRHGLSPAYEKRMRANRKAWAFYQAQPPWYQRTSAHWVMSAKKEETRERRLAALIEDSASGRPIGPLRRNPKPA